MAATRRLTLGQTAGQPDENVYYISSFQGEHQPFVGFTSRLSMGSPGQNVYVYVPFSLPNLLGPQSFKHENIPTTQPEFSHSLWTYLWT